MASYHKVAASVAHHQEVCRPVDNSFLPVVQVWNSLTWSPRTRLLPQMARGQNPLTFIAALIVAFAHWNASQRALACFQTETAYVGDDLPNSGAVEAESAEECQKACQNNAACGHWTFDGEHHQCDLKGNDAQSHAVPNPLSVSGPRYCTLPSQCTAYGVEFNSSSDVERIEDGSVPNPEACQSLCAQHPECAFWTYILTSRHCYLKDQRAYVLQRRYKAAAVSGPKHCPPTLKLMCYQRDMDYVWEPKGKKLAYHQNVGSAKECQELCQLDSACHVFTYLEETKLCVLGESMRYPIFKLGATTGPKFCVPPESTGENVEIFGQNIATYRTPSYVACQQLCENNPLCSAATYNTKSRTCVHKQTAQFVEHIVSGPKICKWLGPFSQEHTGQPSGLTGAAEMPADNPIGRIRVDTSPRAATQVHTERIRFAKEGESLCLLHGFRPHYTYRWQHDMYALREVSHELQHTGSTGLSTPDFQHAGEGCFHRGVEFLGKNVGTAVAEGPAACQRICRENELCSVFTYNTTLMLCVQRQRARWAPGWVSFEKQERRRDAHVVEPLSQENANTLSVIPVENKCFSRGFEYEGTALVSTTKAESAEACQTLCQKVLFCNYFTYYKTEQLCSLLQAPGRKVPKEDSVCGPKFCGVEAPTNVTKGDLPHCFLTGYFYDGPSLTHMRGVVSAADCQSCCQKKSLCRSFSYFRKKQLCKLHVGSGDLVEDRDAVAGPRICPALPERTVDGDADLSRWETRSSTVQDNVASAESCMEVCATKPFCDVFTYTESQRRCMLHSGYRIVKAEESWTSGRPLRESSIEECGSDGLRRDCPAYAYKTGLASARDCQRLCENDPFCKESTFYEEDAVRILVQQQGGKMLDDSAMSKPQFSVRQDRKQIESCLLTGSCSPEEVPAIAFKDDVTSAEECERLCDDNPLCSVFTYASVQQTCKLHPEDAELQSDTDVEHRTLGDSLTKTEPSDCFSHGFYYDGPAVSFSTKVMGAKECQGLCQEEPLCKFFSYFIREKMCGLLPEQGNKVPEPDAICGPRHCYLDNWEAR